MEPAFNLLRLSLPAPGPTVEEHGAEALEVCTKDWVFFLRTLDEPGHENMQSAMRGIARRDESSRLDVLEAPGTSTIGRLLRGIDDRGRAVQVQYLASFGEGWAYGGASSRDGDAFDPRPVDRFVQSIGLAAEPRPEAEVLPAWRAYQRLARRAGTPLAKFCLSQQPSPILVGEGPIDPSRWSAFTREEHQRGGRQLAADLVEFYTRGDPASVRLDLWLEPPPAVADREAIFEAELDLSGGRVAFFSFDTTVDSPVPPGLYDVSVGRVNPDREDERFLVDSERFARDDLERYEVVLKPRNDRPPRP